MARKAYGVEQIIAKLREIELLCNQGNTIAEAARQADLLPMEEYGGMLPSDMKRLKQLEEENGKLKKLVADLSLDKAMLQDVLSKKW